MAYSLDLKTNDELLDLREMYSGKVKRLEEQLLESDNAKEIETLSEKIIRLAGKQASTDSEITARKI